MKNFSNSSPGKELKEIYSVACWPTLLSVSIYILSDKNFCQMEILITEMRVSFLCLNSISFPSPLSTLSLNWIMKPGGRPFGHDLSPNSYIWKLIIGYGWTYTAQNYLANLIVISSETHTSSKQTKTSQHTLLPTIDRQTRLCSYFSSKLNRYLIDVKS